MQKNLKSDIFSHRDVFFSHRDEKSVGINKNNFQRPENVIELHKTQKKWRFRQQKNAVIVAEEKKVKKKGFSGDGGARGVDRWACWR